MTPVANVSLHLAAAGLVAALFSGGCAMMEPRADAYVPPPVGASWTNAYRNTGSYGKDAQYQVTRGEGTWQERKVITFNVSNGNTIMAEPENGRWLAIVGPTGKTALSWEPAVGWHYPLYVGRSWTVSHRQTIHAANRVVAFDLTCKVDGYGDVAVPAGTFKAFEVGCSNTIGSNDRYWFSPDLGIFVKTSLTRGSGSPAGPGTQQTELVSLSVKK
jgi:hypothetical protein